MTWTPEKTAELIRLRSKGLSQAQIARRLGCTRNMVCGKLWRLDERAQAPESNIGRPIDDGKTHKNARCVWDERTFAPYSEWKSERKKERELGLR